MYNRDERVQSVVPVKANAEEGPKDANRDWGAGGEGEVVQ